jgi:hypothetical protein
VLVRRGALGGTRTPNLLIRSQMLYPLSYERICNQAVYPLELTSVHLAMLTCGLAADATVLVSVLRRCKSI